MSTILDYIFEGDYVNLGLVDGNAFYGAVKSIDELYMVLLVDEVDSEEVHVYNTLVPLDKITFISLLDRLSDDEEE